MIHNHTTAQPPGPRAARIVQTTKWVQAKPKLLDACRARYGDVFTLRLLPAAVVGPGVQAAGDERGR